MNDQDNNEVTIFVCMKPKANPSVHFNIYSAAETGQQIKIRPENVVVKAILVPKIVKEAKKDKKKNKDPDPVLEDYEFEVLWDADHRQWITELVNGKYLINVKAPGHPEFNQYIKVKKGKREFDLVCLQNKAATINLKI